MTSPWEGVLWHEIYSFMSPSPTSATYQIWKRLAKQTDAKSIAIGHQSDSGDLTILHI